MPYAVLLRSQLYTQHCRNVAIHKAELEDQLAWKTTNFHTERVDK
jgi:hypothetical protein